MVQSPDDSHLVMCTEVLVFLYDLQFFASPHQNCPDPTACQVGVQLGREYEDSSWRQSLHRQKGRQKWTLSVLLSSRQKL